jgi:uncharacterized protein (DUF885 family)
LKLDFAIILHEIELQRIRLTMPVPVLSSQDLQKVSGLHEVPDGRAWYIYYLKRWTDVSVTPEQIFTLGKQQTERARDQIEAIRKKLRLNNEDFKNLLAADSFFISQPEVLQVQFLQTKATVFEYLANEFKNYTLPDVLIEKGINPALKQAPGYYNNNTFYYNLFDEPYNRRGIHWLYLHEAVPGHHLQYTTMQNLSPNSVARQFPSYGYIEGWAAYVEEIGDRLGLYERWYDELGKWEWDLVRSIRLMLDVGLNYYGWDESKAQSFWLTHFPDTEELALREIARVKRWPGQAVSYKYGAAKIYSWRLALEQKPNFNPRIFHDYILRSGPLPLRLLEKNIMAMKF